MLILLLIPNKTLLIKAQYTDVIDFSSIQYLSSNEYGLCATIALFLAIDQIFCIVKI